MAHGAAPHGMAQDCERLGFCGSGDSIVSGQTGRGSGEAVAFKEVFVGTNYQVENASGIPYIDRYGAMEPPSAIAGAEE